MPLISFWVTELSYRGYRNPNGDNYSVAPGQRPHSFGLSHNALWA